MKRQLSSTSSENEPQRNVRSRNPCTPSMPRQSAVSLEQPYVNFQPGDPSMAPNRHAYHQSPKSVSGENICSSSYAPHGLQALAGSTSPPVPQRNARRNARIRNPFARSIAPHFCVFTQQERQRVVSLEQPHSFQPGVQSVAPNRHADHQSPTSVPGESISDSSDATHNLHPFWTLLPPVARRWNYTRVILSSVAPPTGSHSLVRFTATHLSEQPQNHSSQGQTSNHSQYQNPQIIQAVRHHDMPMNVNRMSYEVFLSTELSKFVKNIICCGEQDEAERCVICLEQYVVADIKGQLKCGHEYHFSCIGKWMEEQVVCPICRQRAAHFEQ